jgi:hypothetical protein
MRKRAFISMAMLSLALAADAAAQCVVPETTSAIGPSKPDLFKRIIANQKKDEAAMDLYERVERVETRKGPSDPNSPVVKVSRVIPSGTGMYKIAVGDDGKPRDAAAYRASLEGLAQSLSLLVDDARSQRQALEKYAKRKKDRDDLIDATHTAFLFTLTASEQRGDRVLSRYKMDPNPAFKPTTRFTSIFPKVRGFVWIDEASGELARIEGDVTEDISVGLFLGKIYKGSHFMQERYEVQPGLWLASFTQYDFDGRKLFSGFSVHERTFYSNYHYIGPPKEALAVIREELGHAELDKQRAGPADP